MTDQGSNHRGLRPVFLVYTHREPEVFGRCVQRLAPYDVVCHVDAKTDIGPFRDAVGTDGTGSRVHFVGERVLVNWAGWSQMEAIRSMVRRGLEHAADDDYLVLLSGQDYPIKPVQALVHHLERHRGTQFLRHVLVRDADAGYRRQTSPTYHRDLALLQRSMPRWRRPRNAVIRTIEALHRASPRRRPVPAGLDLAWGPTHFALQARCLQTLEASVTDEMVAYFRRVFCPEESFYQTLIANSPYRSSVYDGGPVPFRGRGNWRYANLHHIDPSLTKVYTDANWAEVAASDAYFLRKLESDRSAALLDRIDRELLGRS